MSDEQPITIKAFVLGINPDTTTPTTQADGMDKLSLQIAGDLVNVLHKGEIVGFLNHAAASKARQIIRERTPVVVDFVAHRATSIEVLISTGASEKQSLPSQRVEVIDDKSIKINSFSEQGDPKQSGTSSSHLTRKTPPPPQTSAHSELENFIKHRRDRESSAHSDRENIEIVRTKRGHQPNIERSSSAATKSLQAEDNPSRPRNRFTFLRTLAAGSAIVVAVVLYQDMASVDYKLWNRSQSTDDSVTVGHTAKNSQTQKNPNNQSINDQNNIANNKKNGRKNDIQSEPATVAERSNFRQEISDELQKRVDEEFGSTENGGNWITVTVYFQSSGGISSYKPFGQNSDDLKVLRKIFSKPLPPAPKGVTSVSINVIRPLPLRASNDHQRTNEQIKIDTISDSVEYWPNTQDLSVQALEEETTRPPFGDDRSAKISPLPRTQAPAKTASSEIAAATSTFKLVKNGDPDSITDSNEALTNRYRIIRNDDRVTPFIFTADMETYMAYGYHYDNDFVSRLTTDFDRKRSEIILRHAGELDSSPQIVLLQVALGEKLWLIPVYFRF